MKGKKEGNSHYMKKSLCVSTIQKLYTTITSMNSYKHKHLMVCGVDGT